MIVVQPAITPPEDRGHPDGAGAEDDKRAARGRVEAVEDAAGTRLEAAAEGRSYIEWDLGVDAHDVALVGHGVRCEAGLAEEVRVHVAEDTRVIGGPAPCEVVLEELVAVRRLAALACPAAAARVKRHPDAITDGDLGHGCADRFDDPGTFVAQHRGKGYGIPLVTADEIRVADTRRGDFDENLVRPQLAELQLTQVERRALARRHCSRRLHLVLSFGMTSSRKLPCGR